MTKHLGRSAPGDSTDEHETPPEGPDLADRIRQERIYVGLSQADVAEALGISRAAVSALETGKRRVSGLELGRMAELFGTSVDRLLGRDVPTDETTTALFRATNSLTDADKEQVLRFAEFLRGAGKAPAVELPQDVDE
jgi:transcriptional regulator with XRE-family HTH domain